MSGERFAAAQNRIKSVHAARRSQREQIQLSHENVASETPFAKLPRPLDRAAVPILSLWNTLIASEGTKPALRVGQVDAELLDEELLSLLKSQIGEGLKYFGAHLSDDWTREITLGIRAILFKISIWDNNASYGAALQNLRFSDARKTDGGFNSPTLAQKTLYGFVTVLGKYGWEKLEDWLVEQEGGYAEPSPSVRMLSRVARRLNSVHSIAAFVSFIIFLVNGRYRTLVDRVLRIRLVAPVSHIGRQVSFEYLNRQLVWHAFTEFLLFLLPLVGISRWRRWLSRMWKQARGTTAGGDATEASKQKAGPLAFLPERTCGICYETQSPSSTSENDVLGANTGGAGGVIGSALTDIVNPYQTKPCGCVFCFVCIASKIEAEEGAGWACLRCGELVFKCQPWNGDVVETKTKVKNKSVGFAISNKASEEDHVDHEFDNRYQPSRAEQTQETKANEWDVDDGFRSAEAG